jgi:hypothetical protein
VQKAKFFKAFILALCFTGQAATAGVITNISFTSNGGSIANDTINGNFTSPLAFTLTGASSNPFLNNPDTTISLGFGDYYAIAFLGAAQHVGNGTVSFLLDGTTTVTQNITFPASTLAGNRFASFNLPGGDLVQISTTGISADRIRIVANAGGLQTDGAADAFYNFSYKAAASVPLPTSVGLMALGLAAFGFGRRGKNKNG